MKSNGWYNYLMFQGKYRVYLDGKLVAEKENSITRAGRSIILKSLMGLVPNIGGSIQIGIDNTANGAIDLVTAVTSAGVITYTTKYNHQYKVGDIVSITGNTISEYNLSNVTITQVPDAITFKVSGTGNVTSGERGVVQLTTSLDGLIPNDRLGFSVGSSPVTLAYLDNLGSFDAMVFKTSLSPTGPLAEAFKIYELGLFPYALENVVQKQTTLFNGSAADGWLNNNTPLLFGTSLSTSSYIDSTITNYPFKIGDTALFLKASETITSNSILTGMGDTVYGPEDYLSIAYSKISGDKPAITLRFYTNANSYYTFNFETAPNDTQKIISKKKSEAVVTGTPTWSDIQKVEINSSTDCAIDAIRFNDNNNLDTTHGMISRTVLDQPIVKASNQELDIEYYLSLTFNKTVT